MLIQRAISTKTIINASIKTLIAEILTTRLHFGENGAPAITIKAVAVATNAASHCASTDFISAILAPQRQAAAPRR